MTNCDRHLEWDRVAVDAKMCWARWQPYRLGRPALAVGWRAATLGHTPPYNRNPIYPELRKGCGLRRRSGTPPHIVSPFKKYLRKGVRQKSLTPAPGNPPDSRSHIEVVLKKNCARGIIFLASLLDPPSRRTRCRDTCLYIGSASKIEKRKRNLSLDTDSRQQPAIEGANRRPGVVA